MNAEQLWLQWTANVDEVLLLLAQGYKRDSFTFEWRAAYEGGLSEAEAAKEAALKSGFFPACTEEDLDDILGEDGMGDLGRYSDEDDLAGEFE